MAPELLRVGVHESYIVSPTADVWAMAIVIYAVLIDSLPWDEATDNDHMYSDFVAEADAHSPVRAKHSIAWGLMHQTLRLTMFAMLDANKTQRPPMSTVVEALKGQWLADDVDPNI